ncbi:MAG TPA: lipoprotein-releasing ABC transporter ATP-binding protein LolD [Gammaproteobacteria bacterium]
MNKAAVIECRGLTKTFTEIGAPVEVLKSIDLRVHAGQQLAVIGASGSGKSTLLHLLGGLDRPTAGSILIGGTDINNMSDAECGRLRNRMLGFVYQFHHLLPEFTALENVAMPLLIRGTAVMEARDRAAALLQQVGLERRFEHKPAELSGGERQRAAVARALVTQPACILADEPTGNLDRRNALQIYDLMLELNTAQATAMIIVTHDHELAQKMTSICRLENGQLHCG